MVIKVYISGISGNKEVKKRQQRVLMILESKNITFEAVDIAEPDNEKAKEFMQSNSKSLGATVGDANPRSPLPPQIFNDEEYCGDYDQFDLSNEIDEIEKFLKMASDDSAPVVTSSAEVKLGNGETKSENDQNENEAEAKQDVNEDVPTTEKPTEQDEVTEAAVTEAEVTEAEVTEAEVTESKVETEVEPDTKMENGSSVEADSSPTDVEA